MEYRILITGGAGFVGSNLVDYFLKKGNEIIIFDNLSRPGGGSEKNLKILLDKNRGSKKFKFVKGDIRVLSELEREMKDVDVVFHVAAQTAMTTSITNPAEDFEVNAKGTFNVLEAARRSGSDPIMVYTSTNKVYGDLTKKKVELVETKTRWDFIGKDFVNGVDESYPIDFEGPYGCSKGIGDSYFLDYARTFDMKNVVFRMSGIYGISQHPTEDQGWIAWIVRRAMEKQPITIYGDGKQVRDILFCGDLVKAFEMVVKNINKTKGQPYNIGGSRRNSISIIELLELMKNKLCIEPSKISYDEWRRADQKVYISNTTKAKKDFGWEPETSMEEGIRKMFEWLKGFNVANA
jgi:CDP-paratose 2-epimerase